MIIKYKSHKGLLFTSEVFKQLSNVVTTTKGKTYRYFPYWLEELENGDLMVHPITDSHKLPEDLVEAIKAMRQ